MHPPASASPDSSASVEAQRARKRPKIRRTTFACARCHRRKIKCDGMKPACSNCVQAKQPCNGILDGESKTVIPRSIAQYLQEKIAEKEAYLQKLGVDTETDPSAPASTYAGALEPPGASRLHTLSPDAHDSKLLGPPEERPRTQHLQRWDLATEASRSFSKALGRSLLSSEVKFPCGTFLFASSHLPSATPLPVDAEIKEEYFKPRGGATALDQIPKAVAERLVTNYIEKIAPLYPFMDRPDLWVRFNRVQNAQQPGATPPSTFDIFIVSMMLAISIMTSKFNDSSKVASTSERLFQCALQHAETLYNTSFQALQGALILIQYSYLMPRAASLWDIVGLAARMALELGLHRDPDELPGNPFTEAEMERRRAVFWVLYAFDRSICATSHRRLGVSDESISTRFPSGMDDEYFIENVRFRRIQSELWTVNYLRRGMPLLPDEGSYAAWVQDIENRMISWRNEVCAKKPSRQDWCDIAIWHGFVFLHRPCPRNPHPSMESLIKCFENATQVAAGYWENAHSGFLKYSWHAVHHGFEAAIAMLYAIRHCKEQLKERYGTRKILETVHLFSSLFVLMSERWAQAHASLESYERCKSVVMRELTRPGPAQPPTENDELDRLILPQQAQVRRWDGSSEGATPPSVGPPSSAPSWGNTPQSQRFQHPGPAYAAPDAAPQLFSEPNLSRPLAVLHSSPSPYPRPPGPGVPPQHTQPHHPPPPPPQQQQQQSHPHPQAPLPSWSLPPHSSAAPQPQHVSFSAGGGPEYPPAFERYDMWNAPGPAGAPVDWDEMVGQPDASGVDGMILWSM